MAMGSLLGHYGASESGRQCGPESSLDRRHLVLHTGADLLFGYSPAVTPAQ
ncbi:predicted protein [Streptomyces iranensis]|uniref:Uncharacterized protein n=1 Tax=Streptomyces iranensis TaxID=576784 RepID=A0A060ZKZ6_9ACTN|nr:predicted protein [Streptomyces iranensis]